MEASGPEDRTANGKEQTVIVTFKTMAWTPRQHINFTSFPSLPLFLDKPIVKVRGRLFEIMANPGLDLAVVVVSIQNSRTVLYSKVFHHPMFFTTSKYIKPALYTYNISSPISITHLFPFSHSHTFNYANLPSRRQNQHSHYQHLYHHYIRTPFTRRRVPGGVRQG